MSSVEHIESRLQALDDRTSAEFDTRTLNDMYLVLEGGGGTS